MRVMKYINEVAELLLKGYTVVFPLKYLQGHERRLAELYIIAASLDKGTTDAAVPTYQLHRDAGAPLQVFQKELPVWVLERGKYEYMLRCEQNLTACQTPSSTKRISWFL